MNMKRLSRMITASAGCLAFIGCGGASATSAKTTKAKGLPVRTATVAARDLDETIVLTGTLRPRAQIQVVAQVSARLMKVQRDEGSRVAKGDVLASLDDADYRLSHDRSQAALATAEANRAHAVAERDRAESLLKTGGITDKDRLSADVALQVAEAAVAQARAEESIAALQLGRCQITAPFDGRVAKRHADAGAMLASGTPLFTLVDDAVLEFRAAAPSTDWAKAKVGAPVDVTADALPGYHAQGRVARVVPLIDERSRSFDVVVEVPGGRDLVGGLFARAAIRVGRVAGALVVPTQALVRDGGAPGEAQTFVVAGGVAERRPVSLGVEAPDGIQVVKGLVAGDVVVLDPPVALTSGSAVEPQMQRE
jgi:membrane fusion protein (multidrug efflux system)